MNRCRSRINIAENYDEKESIAPKVGRCLYIKATTETAMTVLIEIRYRGKEDFIKRALYYLSYNYSSSLNRCSFYDELKPTVNITNFILTDEDKVHSCYILKELNNNKILTYHCQLHFLELPKFNLKDIDEIEDFHKEFISWIKFFYINEEDMSISMKENTIFEEIEKNAVHLLMTDQ